MAARSFLILLLVSTSWGAHGLSLQPIPAPAEDRLPIDRDGPGVECSQIVERLVKYNEMARTHDLSISSFLSEVVQKMNDWYAQLQPLEGVNREIPVGTFSVLEDGAGKISLVTDKAFDNTGLLAGELDRIIQSLRGCIEANKSLKSIPTGG